MKGNLLSRKNNPRDWLKSLSTGFGGMAYESEKQHQARKTGNTKEKDYIIDTCYAADTEYYETGISYKNINGGEWIIVDEYDTEEKSIKGHKKWVKHMKTKPKKLWSIKWNEWEK